MQIRVNGEVHHLPDGATVSHLLEQLQITQTRVAVEINLEIVPRGAYAGRTLQEGDRIEIVHFVGGG